MGRPTTPPAVRFWAKVDKTDSCWLWTGARINGYGAFSYGGGVRGYAHRWAWEAANGRIPEGMEIDHLCRTRNCVNVDHLEVVTPQENWRRSREYRLEALSTRDAAGRFATVGRATADEQWRRRR